MEILFQANPKIATGERVSVCSQDVRGGGQCLYDLGEGTWQPAHSLVEGYFTQEEQIS